jgi:hypothetical protein
MTEKKYTAALLIIISLAVVMYSCQHPRPVHYDLKVVKLEQGWGYEIRKNNKSFIYQQYIPALEGNVAFSDKKSAKKTGKFVLTKLRNNQLPSLTIPELKQLGIIEE